MVDDFITEIASQISFGLAMKDEGKQIMKEYQEDNGGDDLVGVCVD